jgi:ornithine cyclodeaminase/alanine dehydrogenase-like protein (mu-crystallin family)
MIQISAEQVIDNLSMKDCIDSMEALFRNEWDDLSSQKSNRTITCVDNDSVILTMPGYSEKLGRFAVKVVSEYRSNPSRFGKKVQGGCIILFDSSNSELLAMIDSAQLTAMRTGAVSALATKLLSRQDSRKVGLIGSGEQARSILEGVASVRQIKEAFVFSRNYSHSKLFSEEMSTRLKIPVYPCQSKEELSSKEIDIVVAATNSSSPVLCWNEDIKAGMHINSIGTLPDRRELDDETISRSRLFVDSMPGVLSEAGDVMHAIQADVIDKSHIIGDLSDLLNGKEEGRRRPDEVTLFKSVGFSLQDVYASSKLYENVDKK